MNYLFSKVSNRKWQDKDEALLLLLLKACWQYKASYDESIVVVFVKSASDERDIVVLPPLTCVRASVRPSGPELLYFYIDFKIIWPSCSP